MGKAKPAQKGEGVAGQGATEETHQVDPLFALNDGGVGLLWLSQTIEPPKTRVSRTVGEQNLCTRLAVCAVALPGC